MSARGPRPFDPNAPNDPEVEAAFRDVPDTMIAEIIDGELHVMSRPQHSRDARGLRLDGAPGAPHFLLIDTYEGEEIVRAEPFHAIELRLESLWAA